jgi:hypothetical protein
VHCAFPLLPPPYLAATGDMRETGHRKLQSLVKVPKELLQLQQKVCIGIDILFVNGHIFLMMYSRKICLTTVTPLINHKPSEVWVAMHKIYQMYMLCMFHIVEIESLLGWRIKLHSSLSLKS